MDAKLIESLDRSRYKLMLWDAICTVVLGGILIVLIFVPKELLTVPMVLLVAVSGVISGRNRRLENKIGMNPGVNDALNNELIIHYRNKALRWSFYAMMGTTAIIALLSLWIEVTSLQACIAIFYTGLLSSKTLRLLFLK